MTDEVQQTENNEVKDEVQVPEIEQRALSMGWKPKEHFEGNEDDFIDAKEFVSRKPLYDQMDALKRRAKENERALRELAAHHQKVAEVEYKRALETLKNEKKKALEDGDADKVVELDDQITDVKARALAEQQASQQQPSAPHPDFVAWVNSNPWYAQDQDMRIEADTLGFAIAQKNPGMDPQEVCNEVTKKIKKLYPEKFTNPNRQRQSSVDSGSNQRENKKSDTFELSPEEERAMKTFTSGPKPLMSKEQYLAEIKKVKGL